METLVHPQSIQKKQRSKAAAGNRGGRTRAWMERGHLCSTNRARMSPTAQLLAELLGASWAGAVPYAMPAPTQAPIIPNSGHRGSERTRDPAKPRLQPLRGLMAATAGGQDAWVPFPQEEQGERELPGVGATDCGSCASIYIHASVSP